MAVAADEVQPQIRMKCQAGTGVRVVAVGAVRLLGWWRLRKTAENSLVVGLPQDL